MSASLQVMLLGPIEVLVDGRVVALSGTPQRILVAQLTLRRGGSCPYRSS